MGRDAAGRTVIQLAVNGYVLETLMTFDAEAAQLEPEPDDEDHGVPVLVQLLRPEWRSEAPWGQAASTEPMARRATISSR